MRRTFTTLAIASLFVSGQAAMAAPPAPKELGAVRVSLTRAIAAHDWKSVTTLVAWPVAIDVYEMPPSISRKQFQKTPRTLNLYFGDGDKDLLKCVATAPISRQDNPKQFGARDWVVDCNGNEFYFGQRGGKWLFTAYQNINE